MGDYLDVLRSPAGRLMVVSGVARLSWGIEGLALLFHVEDAADSFAAAGLAVGALGVTSAIFAPLRGALVDRHGGTAMLSLGLLAGALTAAIAITPAVGPEALSYIVLAGLTGVVAPPFTAWTRTGLARNLSGDRLRRAYTIDNVFEESAFVAPAGMGAGVGFVEVAVAAFAEGEGSEGSAGLILAGLSAGGILGALVYGARPWRGSTARQYAVLLGLLGAGLALLALPESVLAMVALAGLAGLAFTPVFIANSLLVEELSPGRPSTVAFTWVSTAMNAGVAVGAAAGGGLVDARGTRGPRRGRSPQQARAHRGSLDRRPSTATK